MFESVNKKTVVHPLFKVGLSLFKRLPEAARLNSDRWSCWYTRINKYEYTKRWIKSAEDFIKYTATKSSMSGRPYTVRCDGREILCAEWLSEELNRFRKKPE